MGNSIVLKEDPIKSLERNLRDLENFISNASWPLLSGHGFDSFNKLECKFRKAVSLAEYYRIDVRKYILSYNQLLEFVEGKNHEYISDACEEILEDYSYAGLRRKEVCKAPYKCRQVKDPFSGRYRNVD